MSRFFVSIRIAFSSQLRAHIYQCAKQEKKEVVDLKLVRPVTTFQNLTKMKCWKMQNTRGKGKEFAAEDHER